jgi:hypothetical protein
MDHASSLNGCVHDNDLASAMESRGLGEKNAASGEERMAA